MDAFMPYAITIGTFAALGWALITQWEQNEKPALEAFRQRKRYRELTGKDKPW